MGLFRFLTKRTKQVQDDVFGLLTFRPYKILKHDYFVGSVFFAPTQTDVDVYLYADYKGPTPAQKDFYKNLETEYHHLLAKAEPAVSDALKKHGQSGSLPEVWSEYKLGCITIPQSTENPAKWVLDFISIYNEDHVISVSFEDDQATEVSLEK